MESHKFHLCNRSRESFLSLDITLVDTINESLKSMVTDLALRPDGALWLKPYRGIPVKPGFPPFEILYLDEDLRVLQEVESYPSPTVTPLKAEPDSAVVLTPHTVLAMLVRPGDQLAICTPDEMAALRANLHIAEPSIPPSISASVIETPAALPASNNGFSSLGAAQSTHETELFQPDRAEPWHTRLMNWFMERPRERRRSDRFPLPGLVGYHWSGSTPTPLLVGNISPTGFFLVTQERPMPGTRILMTLQRSGSSGSDPDDFLAVQSRVVRWGPDGIGFQLLPMETTRSKNNALLGAVNGANRKAIKHFLKQLSLERTPYSAA
ncbi:MAG TPA: PilZ domain-containing protein [Terracidiphilus sp.]|nr:PilZ domain-containing protein [Terracidiphilus sp.]